MISLLGTVRQSDVIFRANGHFDIKARVVRALNIAPGDVIDILTDGCEFYLYVACKARDTTGRYEARCYPSRRATTNHFRGSSKRLCRAMLQACNAQHIAALPCGNSFTDDSGRLVMPIIVRVNLAHNND